MFTSVPKKGPWLVGVVKGLKSNDFVLLLLVVVVLVMVLVLVLLLMMMMMLLSLFSPRFLVL